MVFRIIEEVRVAVERFNQRSEEVSFFSIFKDDHVYLYGSFDSKSLLLGRITQEDDLKWGYWAFDYSSDQFSNEFLSSDLYTFEDVLNIGYQRLANR